MKKAVICLAILSLLTIAVNAFAQNPGMMGPSMMGSEQSEGTQTTTQLIEEGARIFNLNCKVCHVNGGNTINPKMTLRGSLKLKDLKTFLVFIRDTKLPNGSKGSMPSYSKIRISDKQAEELYHYIISKQGPGLK